MKNKITLLAKTGFLLFSILLILFVGFKFCKTKSAKQEGIMPPLASADVPYEIFTINNDSTSVINFKTGSVYKFDKNSLVYKNGDAVHGLVTVKIREFHDAIDIMRAGIPMRTRKNQKEFLESAGMVEVRAFKDSTELVLDKKSVLQTELAAYRPTAGYQLFNLNTNGEWEKKDTFLVKPNELKKQKLAKLLERLSELVSGGKKDIDFEFYSDIAAAPEMKPWLGQKWRVDKENVTDELLKMLRVNWDSVYVKTIDRKTLKYELRFTKVQYNYRDQKNVVTRFNVFASPVKKGTATKDILQKMDDSFAQSDSIRKDIENEIARVKKEADFLSSFAMVKLGFCNIDRLSKMDGIVEVSVKFDYQAKLKSNNKVRLYCLYEENNSTLEFNWALNEKILLRSNEPIKIVSFLPDNQVAIVESDQIKSKLLNGEKNLFFTTKILSFNEFLDTYKKSSP